MPDRGYTRRTRGSARFDPYYKLEWRDVTLSVWKPVQKRFDTFEDAVAYTLADREQRGEDRAWRVMEVTHQGYCPVPGAVPGGPPSPGSGSAS